MRYTHPAARLVAVATFSISLCALMSCASAPEQTPGDEIRATKDPRVVERGRYLVDGPAHCAWCHGDPARAEDLLTGQAVPLSGGRRFELGALGTVVVPNLTSDRASGIGSLDDEALVRSLRYGVSHTGRPLLPFMSFAELSDRDLQAVISFLRTLDPIERTDRDDDLTWLGSLAVKTFLKPQSPPEPPPVHVQPERTAEYGRYLAHSVANCQGCHTKRSKMTGAFVGASFAGGMHFGESNGTFVSPNLTPVPGGMLSELSEQQFIQHFRTRGQMRSTSPMPWPAFARMTDDDLGAIYRYLRALPPAPTPSS